MEFVESEVTGDTNDSFITDSKCSDSIDDSQRSISMTIVSQNIKMFLPSNSFIK